MGSGAPAAPLSRADIHGFRSLPDLNINKLMDEASLRWFRPNEVYAILSNYTHFKIQPQPVETPASGTVLLFDRKMLRNFRKDGHNWKKKKDGKTVQEAHEKLKIGNEERIHVYYARSENDPSFYRRCYWLLDKDLERIVLVHYRHTSEDNAVQLVPVDNVHSSSPLTPVNSTSGSTHSDLSGSAVLSEEINSGELANYTGEECAQLQNHELSLHEINTLEWADLVDISTDTDRTVQRADEISSPGQQKQYELRNAVNDSSLLPSLGLSSSGHPAEIFCDNSLAAVKQMPPGCPEMLEGRENTSSALDYVNSDSQTVGFKSSPVGSDGTAEIFANDIFARQNSFGQWNCLGDDPLDSLNDLNASMSHDDKCDPVITNQEQIFDITDVSPLWAFSTEQTKVLVIGHFYESHKHIIGSNIYCAFGEICVAAEMVQEGVYHCTALPQTPGMVNFFLTLDGHTPISRVLSFEYRSMPTIASGDGLTSSEDDNDWSKSKKLQTQIRLAHLLFSATNNISNLSSKIQLKYLQEAKRFGLLTSPFIEKDWMNLLKLGSDTEISHRPGSEDLLELSLRSKVQEWLLGKIAEGCRTTPLDAQGQGVIHLCAILDYKWAVRLFSLSGLALDFRDAFGWTALHWAAYYGREKMVANLLSAGSNPSLVTDPTSENPGGCTAADLASKGGYEGLSAYLAEKGLAAHFKAMSLAGNITAPPPSTTNNLVNSDNLSSENLSEQELCLKESLAAYRNAADAADRIQAAFRERSLKLQTQAVQLAKPEMEASQIIAALKIQHAFRSHSRRRDMKAAARIQSHFRTWQARRNFLNMRKHAIRIQAVFRGHQIRRQYKKIIWSVGILEKAVLRWRLKRKGLRGIQTEAPGPMKMDEEEEVSIVEEDFFQISRHQAEERVQRSVVRVQAMFRSYQAQQEYRRMKLAHEQAKLEFSMDDAVDFQ